MKPLLLFLFGVATLFATSNANAQEPHDWENPNVIEINRETPHAYSFLEEQKANDPMVRSLDGTWKFKWSPDPQSRPVDFYTENYSTSDWDDIVVPGNWELQGFGTPIYTNITYPFKRDQPKVTGQPDKSYTSFLHRDPVGSYCTTFKIPENWNNKLVFLNFGGVSSAMYVWVNGQKVGYSEDSMLPAEFDVTKYIRKGENKLAVEVYRWSDGSYLEDQDMWRLSGIFRDVDLIAKPKTFIKDFFVKAIPDNSFDNADVSINLTIDNRAEQQVSGLLLESEITGYSKTGNIVDIPLTEKVPVVPQSKQVSLEMKSLINQPKLWSAETPDL